MSDIDSSRRTFIRTTATGLAAAGLSARAYAASSGSNDRIRIGVIGCGTRGFGTHLPSVHKHAEASNVTVAAVCDVWARPREGAASKASEWFGHAPKQFSDYREMLAMKDLDAVMIATPDFQHAKMLEDVANAGKDVYAEKPLAMNMAELNRAVDTVKKAEIVCQVGTQRRSDPHMHGCRELLKSNVLGHISRVEQRYNRNRPNWYIRLPRLAQMKQQDVDWKSFLMHRPDRAYDPLALVGWYGFREFCSGSIGQFMSHFIDSVHMLTGATFPTSAVAQGGTFTWRDDKHKFDCPDHVQTSLIYPEGFLVHFSTNFGNAGGKNTGLFGNRGVLNLDNENNPTIAGEGVFDRKNAAANQQVKPVDCPDHFRNWLDCLRSRETPEASIEAGYQHAVACIMSDRAYETGRRQVFDREKREVRAG
jgi:predicted dehydrogenase